MSKDTRHTYRTEHVKSIFDILKFQKWTCTHADIKRDILDLMHLLASTHLTIRASIRIYS